MNTKRMSGDGTADPPDEPRGAIDRRGHPRFEIDLRCRVAGVPNRLVGRTLNLSRSGVLVRWDGKRALAELPSLYERLTLEIDLPPNGFGRKCIRCRGHVVRLCDGGDDIPEVAVAIEQMEFRDAAVGPVLVARANA